MNSNLLPAGTATEAILVGFDSFETPAVITRLAEVGIAAHQGGFRDCLHPHARLVVIDIRSHHPLMGGPTGWQLVRHLLHCERRVVVVADPLSAVPRDVDSPTAAVLSRFDPTEIAASCRALTPRTLAAA